MTYANVPCAIAQKISGDPNGFQEMGFMGMGGFEPPAHTLSEWYSTWLSYTPFSFGSPPRHFEGF